MSVCNEKGERFEGMLAAEQFVNHFQKYLGHNGKGSEINAHNLFSTKLYEEEALKTVANVNDKEIKEALFDIGENRAPGPDGFHGKMVNWIMTCVTSAAFTIGINGERFGYFKSDDLLVLCHGDEISVKVIKDALMEFSECSGLKPNMEKSVVFFGSVNEGTRQKILDILPFKVGKLPVKYLGIPLLAKKLGINDCQQLVDKGNGSNNKGRSKVAWKEVCRLKNEGGMGLKHLGKSFWMIDEEAGDSGTWKALFELRNKIRLNIIHVIDIHDARINEECSVADMIDDNKWIWSEQWVNKFTQLRNLHVPLLNNKKSDVVKWRKCNGQMIEFSVRNVCKMNAKVLLQSIEDHIRLQLQGLRVKESNQVKLVAA
ncbi:hypothetical protein Tco_0548960 [Tanacetum coccineum]